MFCTFKKRFRKRFWNICSEHNHIEHIEPKKNCQKKQHTQQNLYTWKQTKLEFFEWSQRCLRTKKFYQIEKREIFFYYHAIERQCVSQCDRTVFAIDSYMNVWYIKGNYTYFWIEFNVEKSNRNCIQKKRMCSLLRTSVWTHTPNASYAYLVHSVYTVRTSRKPWIIQIAYNAIIVLLDLKNIDDWTE